MSIFDRSHTKKPPIIFEKVCPHKLTFILHSIKFKIKFCHDSQQQNQK